MKEANSVIEKLFPKFISKAQDTVEDELKDHFIRGPEHPSHKLGPLIKEDTVSSLIDQIDAKVQNEAMTCQVSGATGSLIINAMDKERAKINSNLTPYVSSTDTICQVPLSSEFYYEPSLNYNCFEATREYLKIQFLCSKLVITTVAKEGSGRRLLRLLKTISTLESIMFCVNYRFSRAGKITFLSADPFNSVLAGLKCVKRNKVLCKSDFNPQITGIWDKISSLIKTVQGENFQDYSDIFLRVGIRNTILGLVEHVKMGLEDVNYDGNLSEVINLLSASMSVRLPTNDDVTTWND